MGINSTQAAVVTNTTTNRLYAPGETEQSHPLINYDSAGNQSKDYYSLPGVNYDRTYDAENRMVSSAATDAFGSQTSTYTYDGNGARVKRKVAGTETWQVYGLGGELVAEYAASGAAASPQKRVRLSQRSIVDNGNCGKWRRNTAHRTSRKLEV